MRKLILKYLLHFILILLGSAAGFAYWYFVGCKTGTCPLKALWYYNVAIGGFGGYVLADFILDIKKKRLEKAKTK